MKPWLKFGLIQSAFIFVWNTFISPMIFDDVPKPTLHNGLISLAVSFAINLTVSYLIFRYFVKSKKETTA